MTRAEIEAKIEELYDKLDELEDELTPAEKHEIHNRIAELDYAEADPVEFELDVEIHGTAKITAETLEEARTYLYDALKNNEYMVVERIEIEEV